MYVFGGRGEEPAFRVTDREIYCSEIYYLDTTTHTWIRPNVYGNKPLGRRSHSACMLNTLNYNKNKNKLTFMQN